MVNITGKASVALAHFLQDEINKGKSLRVYVEGGGCAGFQYGLKFDDPTDLDEVTHEDSISLIIDPMSSMYLEGCTLDWIDGLYGAGFKIINPNATDHCGCGHSFST